MKSVKLTFAIFALIPDLAAAHPGHSTSENFASLTAGLIHPMTSLEHILIFLVMGVWSAQASGQLFRFLFVTLVLSCWLGCLFNVFGNTLLYVDQAIVLSALVFAVIVNCVRGFSFNTALIMMSSAAFFQGYNSGTELAFSADWLMFGLGWAIAIVILFGIGRISGHLLSVYSNRYGLRHDFKDSIS